MTVNPTTKRSEGTRTDSLRSQEDWVSPRLVAEAGNPPQIGIKFVKVIGTRQEVEADGDTALLSVVPFPIRRPYA